MKVHDILSYAKVYFSAMNCFLNPKHLFGKQLPSIFLLRTYCQGNAQFDTLGVVFNSQCIYKQHMPANERSGCMRALLFTGTYYAQPNTIPFNKLS